MKKSCLSLLLTGIVSSTSASITVNCDWEDGSGTILSSYGNLSNPLNVAIGSDPGTNNETPSYDPALVVTPHGGTRMLQVSEDPHSGTPQAFVAFIENLSEGDLVTASFWGWDSTVAATPSMRLWGHYAFNGDIDDYRGSAGGNSNYTVGAVNGQWSQLSHTWTVAAGQEALVIEARLYSTPSTSSTNSTSYWIDDLQVTAPDGATITIPVPEPTTLTFGLMGLAVVWRRQRPSKLDGE